MLLVTSLIISAITFLMTIVTCVLWSWSTGHPYTFVQIILTFYFRQEIQQLRNSVLRQKEKLEKKPSEEKKPELRNSGCQTHGRGGSFRRQKRERWAEFLSVHKKLIKIHLKMIFSLGASSIIILPCQSLADFNYANFVKKDVK